MAIYDEQNNYFKSIIVKYEIVRVFFNHSKRCRINILRIELIY